MSINIGQDMSWYAKIMSRYGQPKKNLFKGQWSLLGPYYVFVELDSLSVKLDNLSVKLIALETVESFGQMIYPSRLQLFSFTFYQEDIEVEDWCYGGHDGIMTWHDANKPQDKFEARILSDFVGCKVHSVGLRDLGIQTNFHNF